MWCHGNAGCQDAADIYNKLLAGNDEVITPTILPLYRSSWGQYTILIKDTIRREDLIQEFKAEDIPTMIYYRKPMHMQKAFEPLRVKTECPIAEQICQRCLSLPMGPYLGENDIRRVCKIINEQGKSKG